MDSYTDYVFPKHSVVERDTIAEEEHMYFYFYLLRKKMNETDIYNDSRTTT
jgi:hypothetical protein